MKSPKLMLIDDDEAAHIYHMAMLEIAGFDLANVHTYYTVDDAIKDLSIINSDYSAAFRPDYIFVDINMPIKSGYEFVDEYLELELDIHPQIYFVSTSLADHDLLKISRLPIIKGYETKFLDTEFFKNLL